MADGKPVTLAGLLRRARGLLADAGIEDPALDARLIVEHFSGTNRTEAISTPQREIEAGAAAAIEAAVERRVAGEPVHRILGFREFYGLRLSLSPETLEPRPDTETLVDAVLPFARAAAEREGACRVLDLGTGTGAVALAVLSPGESAVATGVDFSNGALTTATRNAEALGLAARFTAIRSDWFENISGRFHVIAANPPYISWQELASLSDEVRNFDPAKALDGGADGLDAYRAIAAQAERHLEPNGIVAVEIGHAQKSAAIELFSRSDYRLLEARRDLAGHDRVLVFDRKSGI